MSRFDKLFEAKKQPLSEAEPELPVAPAAASTPMKRVAKTAVSGEGAIANEPGALAKYKDPSYVRTTVYLPKAVHKKLKAAAAEEEREMSDIVASLVQDWLTRKDV